MHALAHSPVKSIGVLATSMERFQSIANFLNEPCVWLAEPVVDKPAAVVDMLIIDSELLTTDPARIMAWREFYRSSTSSARVDTCKLAGSPTIQTDASLPHSEGMAYFREYLHQHPVSPPRKPVRVIIYQCSGHLDVDDSL